MAFVLSFCYILFIPQTTSAASYDVTAYGAKGDGYTDDTNAFNQAWAGVCNDTSRYPTLVIPPGKTFLIGLIMFNGPCKFPAVNVEGGTGYARRIVYEDITMSTRSSVHVYDVKYLNIHGSLETNQAITFDCSKRFKCYGIYTNQVEITGPGVFSYCNNAKGEFVSTYPSVRCS
ncbi:exopolygalacturonase clone GBGA483-like [Bidens hawaiensis]|uniref:exopolygalacturonase clone GBGA483-like n=1 Tax=Bidens hawaiensis TaxID=980011 RepID=UPI0040493BB7